MSEEIKIYSLDDIKYLSNHPSILKIKNRSQIIYSDDFKYFAILNKIVYPSKSGSEIFEEVGIKNSIISNDASEKIINFWIRQYKKFGDKYVFDKNKNNKALKILLETKGKNLVEF